MPDDTSISPYGSLESVPVRVLLSSGLQVEGSVVVSAEANRFSDAWEEMLRDSREFLPVTEAESRAPGRAFEESEAFLLVRKRDIVAVRPLNEK
jgi:hypothetical protein